MATVLCLTVGVVGEARAQLLDELLNPSTTVPPPAESPAPDSPPTTWALLPLPIEETPAPAPAPPGPGPAPAGPAPGGPAAGSSPFGDGEGEGVAPPEGAGPFPEDLAALMRSVRRSGSRNTAALIEGLKALTDLGMPHDEALRVGMGAFPVGGPTTYSHDWWFPRFGPGWRLHQGTDLFAVRGTPVRSPAAGTVRLANGGLGGRSTYVVQDDGTYFYMAHLDRWPDGLHDGQVVNVGDVVGHVGSTGNAQGGSPHLHFEVHPAVKVVQVGKGRRATTKVVHSPVRPGTILPAADPKALLDTYLQAAIDNLPNLVAAHQASLPPPPPAVAPGAAVDPELIGPSLRLASRRGLLLSGARPQLSVPLVGFAFLLVVMLGCLTPVLGTRVKIRPLALAGGGGGFDDLAPAVAPPESERGGEGRRARRRRGGGAGTAAAVTAAMTAAPPPMVAAGAGDGGTGGHPEGRRRRFRRKVPTAT